MQVAEIRKNEDQSSSGKAESALKIALIVHGVTFLVILLQWLFSWFICPISVMDICASPTTTLYTWVQLVAILLLLGAVIVNVAKKDAKLTSYLALAHCVLAIYYLIAFWFFGTGKGLRLEGRLFQKILFYVYQALWIACIIVPAFMGGLM